MTEFIPCTERHPLSDGEVQLLGAVRQVTGAATRVTMGKARILVDCGVTQGRERKPMSDEVMNADALVLTHGHLDHIGHVPDILERGWDKTIYATNATLEIARISLEHSMNMKRASQRT